MRHQAPLDPRAAVCAPSRLDALLDPEAMKALADPVRARLFTCLVKCARPLSVSEVATCCDRDFSTVARHLAQLARCGWLEARREGRSVLYAAPAAALAARLRALADALESSAGPRPDAGTECCS